MKNAIIATDVGDTKKMVTSENGFLVKEFDTESVLKSFKTAISDEKRLELMGSVSAHKIENKFSMDRYLDDLEKIYEALM